MRSIARLSPMKAEVRPSVPTSEPKEMDGRRALASPLIVLGVAVGLAFVWYYAHSLLLLFAGILFAVLARCLHARARRVSCRCRAPGASAWSCSPCCGIAALAIGWGVVRLPAQARMLMRVMDTPARRAGDAIWRPSASTCSDPAAARTCRISSPIPGRLFGHVQYAVSGAYVVRHQHHRHRVPRPVLRRPSRRPIAKAR